MAGMPKSDLIRKRLLKRQQYGIYRLLYQRSEKINSKLIMFKSKQTNQSGFTLIEILVVIGIIAVLAAIVLIAINPSRQFAQARNAQRTSDASAILNAVGQYIADNKGVLPSAITTTATEIKKSGGIDLCSTLVPTYMAALSMDPSLTNSVGITDCSSAYTTNYLIAKDSNNRVTITANGTENPPATTTIVVTR